MLCEIRPSFSRYATLHKVHIFWEGHTILRNFCRFVLCSASQIYSGLLRMYELYQKLNGQYSGIFWLPSYPYVDISKLKFVKFIFSKKATEIDEIFTVDLTFTYPVHSVKSTVKISSICVAFLENMNFTKIDLWMTTYIPFFDCGFWMAS